jgi:glycosyltransferase involved in cell wall biosynthesis
MTALARRHFSVVAETYPPEINGVALTLGRLVSGVRAHGHAVSVIRPRQHADDDAERPADPTVTLVRGVPLPMYAGLQLGLPATGVLRDYWSKHRPDVVYVATEGPLGYSAVRVARELGLAVFSGFHTDFRTYAKHYHAAPLGPVLLRYLRHFHNRSQGTLVPTADLRDRLHALGFENLHVLGRGVDTRLFRPERRSAALRETWGASDDDLVILHVGRMAPEKNLPVAVQAYRAMRRFCPGLRLVMVGDGPSRAALQRDHPDLIFTGRLAGEQLAAHYASADVFVFPSETETFGNVTLEAMASGLAVIAYDYAAAGVHIRHGESGILVPFADSRAFVAEATTLVRLPRLPARIRQKARASVVCVDWERVVEQFELILTGAQEPDVAELALGRREGS